MKTAVLYLSKTGHSKKIAEAVAAGLGVQAQSVKDHPELSGVDLLFIAGGIYAGKSDPKLLKYLASLDNTQVKQAALISSSGGKTKQDMVRDTLTGKGIQVLADEYVCQGSFLFFGKGHPNAQEITGAVAFAKKLSAAK
jgi:menaquinone-dependent protoporphyrinogen IX oxidase